MSELDSNALKKSLNIIKDLQNIEREFGRDTLITILESVGGFFGLVGVVEPEKVDKKELEKYIVENKTEPQKEKDSAKNADLGPYESDKLEKFGLYGELMKKTENYTNPSEDMSIYDQNPQTISKVVEDRRTHIPANNNVHSDEREQTYNIETSTPYTDGVEQELEEKPLIRVLEQNNNPWSSAGEPVSPGQIKF